MCRKIEADLKSLYVDILKLGKDCRYKIDDCKYCSRHNDLVVIRYLEYSSLLGKVCYGLNKTLYKRNENGQ